MKELTIDKTTAGQRLNKYLLKYFKNATSSFIYKMLRKKNIVLNGKKATGSEMLKEADKIKVFFSDETFEKMRGVAAAKANAHRLDRLPVKPLSIVYEDEDILVVNKPAGLLSQGAKEGDDSVNSRLLAYLWKDKKITEESFALFHPSVVNRLDRNTSGLVLAGKTLAGTQMLTEEIRNHSSQKYYHCFVAGRLEKECKLRDYLIKDPAQNRVFVRKDKTIGALEIKTDVTPLEVFEDYTYVRVHLLTGRTHQIRAHLSFAGYPVIGDPKYGNREVNERFCKKYNVRRQLLHAAEYVMSDGRAFRAQEPELFRQLRNKKG
ncbi:MAG: RluA family pseudouridine synthase [Lachnospiraceae bacterium]|nr:RluA family pseudouridine synthase [Lachnospiraceae bacterium]